MSLPQVGVVPAKPVLAAGCKQFQSDAVLKGFHTVGDVEEEFCTYLSRFHHTLHAVQWNLAEPRSMIEICSL